MSSMHLTAVHHGRSGDLPGRPCGFRGTLTRSLLLAVIFASPTLASAQTTGRAELVGARTQTDTANGTLALPTMPLITPVFRDEADRANYDKARALADNAREFRVVVSMWDRELYVLDGSDTLMVAPVAVAVDTTLNYNGKTWRFETPRGKRKVLSKEANPVWTPPAWHYAEVAARQGLRVGHLGRGRTVSLSDGRKLGIKGDRVGTFDAGGTFTALPVDEEIVFDGVVYEPPTSTANRRIEGELGKYKLSLGEGYLLHGTPHTASIGTAATHGCVRLLDEDIEWLFDQVPVGTPVYIY